MGKMLRFSIAFFLLVLSFGLSPAAGQSLPAMDSINFVENANKNASPAQDYENYLPLVSKPRKPGIIIYVDLEATGANDGTSWEDAFTTVEAAMDVAVSGNDVWVAAGTYYPTAEHCGSGYPHCLSFQLKNGVGVYGGFDPSTGDVGWDNRDWVANVTILSGDTGVRGDPNDNSGHVFYHPEGLNLDRSAILDGFTISDGVGLDLLSSGGGMFNEFSSPELTNIIFTNNHVVHGGGMWNGSSSPILTNVTFDNNEGGGMVNVRSSSPTLTNVAFTNNLSWDDGGGMSNISSSPMLTNVTFSHNSTISGFHGGGLANTDGSSPILTNVTFIGNSSGIGGGMHNASSSPTLINVTFSENSADEGGGMENEFSSPGLENVTFSDNYADYGGGMSNYYSSPMLTNVTFSYNASHQGQGGGMINYHSSPTLNNVTFSANYAWDGGGMMNNSSSPTLTDVTFTDNVASGNSFHGGSGGGMLNMDGSSPLLTNVTFSTNGASRYGGGMANSGACSPILTNVTFSANSAGDEGGGVANFYNSAPALVNVTFSANTADNGGGIYSAYDTSTTLINCILWGDSLPEIIDDIDSSSTITYSDIQALGGYIYPGIGNINSDPLFGSLANNGGFVYTHALGEGSPAIDTGNPDFAACPATDARGVARPQDGDGDGAVICDMGAYEFVP